MSADASTANKGDSLASDLSYKAHRQLIGLIGILLPPALFLINGLRPVEALPQWRPLNSISAYYYTGAVSIFAGALCALAAFLFTYRGYEDSVADRHAGKVGGVAALGIALFPTEPPEGVPWPDWWIEAFQVVHYACAAILFGVFILFALWLFRKSNTPKGQPLERRKQIRNTIYLLSGVTMIVMVAWAVVAGQREAPIFWPETIALVAFAASWLVKGEAHGAAVELARKVMQ